MNTKYPVAATAALLADPARTAMLTALLDGRQHSAGELALVANVSAQSGSMHLAQLLQGGLIVVTQKGRHRFYRLAKPDVANAIEALGAISTPRRYIAAGTNRDLCYARTCYDHLAGELAVRLTDALEQKRMLTRKGRREYELTLLGEKQLRHWNIDPAQLRQSRRHFAARCLDWTERRDHLAGAVGAAICRKFLDLHWLRRERDSRVIHVSPEGKRELAQFLA